MHTRPRDAGLLLAQQQTQLGLGGSHQLLWSWYGLCWLRLQPAVEHMLSGNKAESAP